jgi:hypothetical protein
MNDADRDLHDALGRLAEPQPPPLRSDDVLAAGRRARRRRSLLAGGGAAAGVVAVIAVAGLVASATPAPHRPVPAATPTPTARPIDAPWPQPDVPGFSTAELSQIAHGCADALTGVPGPRAEEWFNRVATVLMQGPSGGPEPAGRLASDRSAPLLSSIVRVHSVLRDRIGTTALIYGPGVTIVCAVGGSGMPYNPWGDAGFYASTAWLSGPVSIDYHESQAGAVAGSPAVPAWDRVAGRAAPGVVRVTVRLGPDVVTVPVINGSYLANVVRGQHDWAIIPGQRKLTVTAYDAAGRVLDPTTCVVDWHGKPYHPPAGKRCPKPVRWP